MLLRRAVVAAARRTKTVSSHDELQSVLSRWKGGRVHLVNEGKVSRILLDRPEKSNCLSGEMMIQLNAVVKSLASLDSCGVVVLEGAGKSFCSGADLGLIDQLSSSSLGAAMFSYMSDCLGRLRRSPQLVVARIEGHCLGGASEIATACDIRALKKDSKIGFLQARMGIVPSWGGASWLEETVGRSTALKLMTSAAVILPEEARHIGYADYVYDGEQDLKAIIKSLSQFDVPVIRAQKSMLKAVQTSPTAEDEVIRSVWGAPAQKLAIKKQLDAVVNKKNN